MRNVSAHTGRLSFCEARKLEQDGSRLISAKLAERVLSEPANVEGPMRSIGKFWTGTIVAYPKANQSFGYELVIPNRPLIFALDTSEFKGEKRLALVFEEFHLREQGNMRIYEPKKIIPLPGFPQESGWHALHESGIPVMNAKSERFLWRWDEARVGPVVRGFGRDRNDVFVHHRPSEKLPTILVQGDIAEQKAQVIPLRAASGNDLRVPKKYSP